MGKVDFSPAVSYNEKCEKEKKRDENDKTKNDISGVFDGAHAFDSMWSAGGGNLAGGC